MNESASDKNRIIAEQLEELRLLNLRIIAEAAMLEQAHLAEETVDNDFAPASENELRAFLKQTDRMLRRKKLLHDIKKAYITVSKVAVILLIILLGGFFTIINVEAFRTPLINWLIDIQETHTSIQFVPDSDEKLDLEFGYLPDGFQVKSIEEGPSSKTYYLESQSGEQIIVMQNDFSTGISIDTEGATVEKIELSGLYPAMSVEKDGLVQLVWTNRSSVFIIEGEIKTSEIIKIAEFIKY